MHCILLMRAATDKLKAEDFIFIGQAERALSLLRSKGVLPIKRATVNGHLHVRFAGMLVEALLRNETVDLPSRRQADLYTLGVTTNLVKWLDASVQHDILIAANGVSKAKGALRLGHLFQDVMISDVVSSFSGTVERQYLEALHS